MTREEILQQISQYPDIQQAVYHDILSDEILISFFLVAYKRGQEEMREMAAKECDWYADISDNDRDSSRWCARDIRNLDINGETK